MKNIGLFSIALLIIVFIGCLGTEQPTVTTTTTVSLTPTQPPLTTSPPLPTTPAPTTTFGAGETTTTVQTTTTSSTSTSTTIKQVLGAPNSNNYELKKIIDGLNAPLYLTHAGDDTDRLFVLEQSGVIRIIDKERNLLKTPFLDISFQVRSGGERGLLGLAFHPNYKENGYFYVHYSDNVGDTVISRFMVSSDPDIADSGSEQIILTQDQPFGNHNGGQIEFGPDGLLYIGLGDGGAAGDPLGNGQNPNTLLGTIIRINVDDEEPYKNPLTNPFTGSAKGRAEVWAYGLRNPWRFSFDRATGDLYIADVGQNSWEEVNFQPADSKGGENYGWNPMEGMHCYISGCNPESFILPVAEYGHKDGCSITGGYVYRGSLDPDLEGIYFYGDYCSGNIWTLYRSTEGDWISNLWMKTSLRISSFGEDEGGEIYVVDHGGGIYQIKKMS